jgi:hypothetical protein
MTCLQNSNTSLTSYKVSQPDDSNRHNHCCENLKSLPILDDDHFHSPTHILTHTYKKNPLVGTVLKQTNMQHLVQMPTYCLKGMSQRRRTRTYKTGMMMKHVSHKWRFNVLHVRTADILYQLFLVMLFRKHMKVARSAVPWRLTKLAYTIK